MVRETINSMKERNKCDIVQFWGWKGDGGLCIFYDVKDHISLTTCINSAFEILEIDLKHLNEKWGSIDIKGELHLKIAIHKGGLRYKGPDNTGSIHSKELNWVSHLEKVIPKDTIAISSDIYEIYKTQEKFYDSEKTYESKRVFLHSIRDKSEVLQDWSNNTTVSDGRTLISIETDVGINEIGLKGVYSQRALTGEYVELFKKAKYSIDILGVGFSGFQSDHKEADVLAKCKEGVKIRFLIADFNIKVEIDSKMISLTDWRDNMTSSKDRSTQINNLIDMIKRINKEINLNKSAKKKLIEYKYSKVIPTFAMFRVDSIIYFSPYFVNSSGLKSFTMKFIEKSRLYDQCINHFNSIWDNVKLSRSNN